MEYALGQLAISVGSPTGELFPTFARLGRSIHDHLVPHPGNDFRPHVLGHRVLGLFSLLLISVKVAAIALPVLTLSPQIADASAITSDTVIALTNQSRQEYGLKDLTYNAKLAKAAQAKADDMLKKQYFAHNSPDGHNPWYWIKGTGYTYLAAGENLAVHFTQAETVEDAWMNSPGHRANILNRNFEEIGIGISEGTFEGADTIFVVQMFGTPSTPQVKTLAEPTQVAPATAPVAQAQQPALPAAKSAQQPAAAASTAAPAVNSSLALSNSIILPTNSGLTITTSAGQGAVKVIATYGLNSYMMNPTGDGNWKMVLPSYAPVAGPVTLTAYDINGKTVTARLASIAPTLEASFSAPSVKGASVNFFGHTVNTNTFQFNFYLISIVALMTFLAVSIGVHYKIQHLGMIANSSFVVMLACLLWMAG